MFGHAKQMRRWMAIAVAIGLVCLSTALAKKPPEPSATIKTVALDVRPGDARSVVHAVEIVDGKIVCVGGQQSADGDQAVLWEVTASGTGYDVTAHDLAGGEHAVAINKNGEAVGLYYTLNEDLLWVTRGLCWTDPGADPIELAPLDGDSEVEPHAINAAGVIVGRSRHKHRTVDEEGNDIVVETSTAAAWRIGEVNE